MTQRYVFLTTILILASVGLWPSRLVAQDRAPLTLDQVIELIESGVFPDERIVFLANQSCLAFQLNPQVAERLREANATEGLVAGLADACIALMVRVTPAEVDLILDANEILRAEALGPDSAVVTPVFFEWSAADTAVIELLGDGLVRAKALGETQVVASIEGGPTGSALVRVRDAAAADSLAEGAGGKSVAATAALGVVVPGGGEFYVGNTAKGAVVLVGAAAALAAGFVISKEDTLTATRELLLPPGCTGSSCQYEVRTTAQVEKTDYLIVGAAVAGAFWLYGLIDGIVTAKRSQAATEAPLEAEQGLSLDIAPRDGIRVNRFGEAEITFIRIRS